jgi:ubiquinone/menaquinone biosynthesis C-methylase UbiE
MHAPPAHALTAYRNTDTLRHNEMTGDVLMRAPAGAARLRPGLFQRLDAALYDRFTARLEQEVLSAHRRRVLQHARGQVLDVGAGTAANLPHYPSGVEQVVLLDPHPGMLARAAARSASLHVSAAIQLGSAEHLPFGDASFETVVCTLSLCTVKDVPTALKEAARVLRLTGRLLVLEHVRSADPSLARWQDRLAPLQRLFANGCNPNRDTLSAIRQAGFDFEWLDTFDEARMPQPIIRPLLLGSATWRH